jgi:hypothetical protein
MPINEETQIKTKARLLQEAALLRKQRLLRVDESTARLLEGFGKPTMNLAILFLWEKVCVQSEEIKEWKLATGAKTPVGFLKNHTSNEIQKS